ncbi:MAG: apolipoprotein N-acyltransferase [bacterium]
MVHILLILCSALLMSLSFHPLGIHFLAWFGLIPVFFIISKAKPGKIFATGILFGFFLSLFSLFWIVFLQIETSIKILMLFGMVLMFLYIGLYYGVSFLLARICGLWVLPFVLAGLEYLRGLGELGFPWLSLGYSQARYPIFIQQAAIYGVYGISFWLVWVNLLLYSFIKNRNFKYLVLFVVIFLSPVIYGFHRLNNIKHTSKMVTAGIVQPNIDPNLKFTPEMRFETFNRLIRLSEECYKKGVNNQLDLIIWPETATPIFLKTASAYQDMVLELSDRLDVPILTGTPIYDRNTHQIYNGAILIEPEKRITQEYKKLHLVPFGEHIPFDRYIPLFRKIEFGQGDYSPGTEYTIFKTEKIKFSCLICFESIFPEISRNFINHGAQMLVNITNDGWFGKISGPQQHNDMAILRAVEHCVPLFRCSNTGISMVVDGYGRIIKETSLFEEDVVVSTIALHSDKCIYTIVGDILPILSLIAIPFLIALKLFQQRFRVQY